MTRHHFIATALLLCLCTPSLAQQQNNPPPAERPAMTIRSYDVSDLLRPARDYPYDSAVVPPTQLKSDDEIPSFEAKEVVVEQHDLVDATAVIDLVLAMVDPESWDGWRPAPKRVVVPPRVSGGGGRGGGGGGDPRLFGQPQNAQQAAQPNPSSDKARLRTLGTALVVLQTEENHKRIAELLTQLRKEAGPLRLVTVRANWLLLDAVDVDTILKPRTSDAKNAAVQEVDLAAFEKVAAKSMRYRGQTTCFNGQTTHIASGRARTIVHDLMAVTGEGVGLFSPKVALVHAGAILQITPLLAPDGTTALLDVQSVVSEWDSPTSAQMPRTAATIPSPAGHDAIDKINMIVHQLKTTLRLPTNKPILVGGMTLEPSTRSDGKQLYLVLEVSSPQS